MEQNSQNPNIITYQSIRRLVGVLGLILPVVLLLGIYMQSIFGHTRFVVPTSISKCYFTNMGDVFVGIICAVAVFLFCYYGFDKKDRIISNLAALFATGVAFFPSYNESKDFHDVVSSLHNVSATLFFLTLAYMSYFQFTKSSHPLENLPAAKLRRNKIYKTCGVIILGSIILLAAYLFLLKSRIPSLEHVPFVLIFETICLWAFGISWLVKGDAIAMLRD
jgi:hypothetical protein